MADPNESANSFEPTGPKERKLSETIPMESVQRLAKIPVVESSLNIATDVYSRVKEASSVLNWTLCTAENTMSRAVEHAIPVAERLERPLKRMDTLLCSSLDYVESKMPAVKLPPQQLLESTSNYVESKLQPAFDKAAELKQFGADKVSAVKNFAMDTSNTSQLVNSCTKMASSGMEVAQRYISNAGTQLTNGEGRQIKLRLPALTLMALVDRARNLLTRPENCVLPSAQPCHRQSLWPLITITPATPSKLNDSNMLIMDAVTPPPCPPPPPPTPAQEKEQTPQPNLTDNDNDTYYSPMNLENKENKAEGNSDEPQPIELLQSLDTDFIEAQAEMEISAKEILVPMI